MIGIADANREYFSTYRNVPSAPRSIRPTGTRVLVEIDPDVETRSGIILGFGRIERNRLLRATVLGLGGKARNVLAHDLEVGDRVLVPRSAGYLEMTANGREQVLLEAKQIELAGDVERVEAM